MVGVVSSLASSCTIVGYVYETDIHCDACAGARFGRCSCPEHEVVDPATDSDGNLITPIFLDDASETDCCADCHEPLL